MKGRSAVKTILLGLVVLAFAVPVSSAFASGSGPTHAVYSSTGQHVQGAVSAAKPATHAAKPTTHSGGNLGATVAKAQPTGQLPFTGLDLSLIVAGGFVLLAIGFGVHRASRRPGA